MRIILKYQTHITSSLKFHIVPTRVVREDDFSIMNMKCTCICQIILSMLAIFSMSFMIFFFPNIEEYTSIKSWKKNNSKIVFRWLCMPSAYIAIATRITGEKTQVWSGNTIKMIISQGSMMYRECKPQAYNYCNVEDLPKYFPLHSSIIEQVELSNRAGVIESQDQNSEMKVSNVYQNLQYIFESPVDSGALLTMSGYTVALLKEQANYWIFDSHKRNTHFREQCKCEVLSPYIGINGISNQT